MNDLTQLGAASGYLAKPDGEAPWAAVIVIQEWWGLDAQTKSIADRIAKEGYLAFAPDLYHGESAKLGDNDAAAKLVQKYGPDAPQETASAFDALKASKECDGNIGTIGFCFGGRVALSVSTLRPVDAVCTFYGGGMQQTFDDLRSKLHAPVLGLFGDADRSIPSGTIAEFDELLTDIGIEHEVVTYPNSGHAFFRDRDPNVYKPEAAKDAWDRVKKFFAENLK